MPVKALSAKKAALRSKHRKIKINLSGGKKSQLDRKLSDNFLSLREYLDCEALLAFASTPIEVDTSRIIKKALSEGKRVALPKCSNEGHMDFYYIESTDTLKEGSFGIFEPEPEKCEKVTDLSRGLCLVPGLCYDLNGCRVGFGRGYYDRFLSVFKGVSVGVCYSCCIEKSLPVDSFDRAVDILITENKVNYTNTNT